MKKTLFPVLFTLLLAACNQPTTLTYDVQFTTDNPNRMTDLSLATRNVVERRLARLGGNLIDYDVAHNKETLETTISIEVDNKNAAQQLNTEMTEPFLFEVRYLVETEQEGDIAVEGLGAFRATGIQQEHIDWVLGDAMPGPQNQGIVTIGFTDEGVAMMQSVLAQREGTTLGLFIRNMLTASMKVNGNDITRTIQIPGVPSADLAKVFADDMNVGIHMTFSPIQ